MRLEATLPDSRGDALVKLADELGLTRSQVVDEAVGLFLKAVLEIRRGRRLVTVDAVTPGPLCEMATPTLATLEWTTNAEPIRLPASTVATACREIRDRGTSRAADSGSRLAWAWARASSWASRGRRRACHDPLTLTLTRVTHASRAPLVANATATAHAHAGRSTLDRRVAHPCGPGA